ncbi:hypothetical protein [Acetobacter cibinongensis]|uniref:Uncharacterized protein n=1 Tax=Acetobacter cibinongensis TaxID=146475 RepID=A0A0D6N3Z9_9PROT|nr:hypothetical protein [Acetobacter cibinongensis]GAN60283.1 hypothetical protein Abci_011_013 [Acetobacter cibinongensis]GBQ18972.1 hypothetical protein AA0482_2426 [Acetobacter cibinongensis NRIC 0482]GEL57987.1 hypothetical protein ACI01nite_05890 [Acetobacter cibinongensis]
MTLSRSNEGLKTTQARPAPVTTGENDMNGGYISTLPAAKRQTARRVTRPA